MKKLALGALFAGLTACGGGGGNNSVQLVDAPTVDAMTTCNPLTQGGCNPGEKCTWINDQDDPPIGHVGCAPDPGATGIAIGGACTEGPAGPMGYDTCVKGAVCLSGECKQICDQAGGAPACDQDHSCTRYADFFEVGGTAVAGVCDPACDPLTQDLKVGAVKQACGSTMATMPTKGCYGYDDYSCAPAGPSVYDLRDRAAPRTNASGNPYLNGCAPGFLPFFYEMTGSTVTKCTGYCAALEIDNTPAHMGNTLGDTTAIGKLPTTAATMGDATCSGAKKGSVAGNSHCKFMWPYVVDRTTMMLPMQFATGPYLDKLGVCQSIGFFQYDSNNDMMPDAPFPACNTLPPLTASTTDEDAADWGCQKFSNSMFDGGKPKLHPALSNVRVPKDLPLEIVRHNLR
jgi:hypothetical protein